MINFETSIQAPAYTSTKIPVQTTTSVVQKDPTVENPIPTVRTLPQGLVRNQLPLKYKNIALPANVVQTRLAPTFLHQLYKYHLHQCQLHFTLKILFPQFSQ